MIFRKYIQRHALKFAEFCGRNADYMPESGLWTYYNGTGTEKKTTDEMMKDFQKKKKEYS